MDQKLPTCKYSDLRDSSTCPHPVANNDLCIYHDPEYGNQNQDRLVDSFKSLVEQAKRSHHPLICRGFYVPEIDLGRVKFDAEVDFTGAHFKKVSFRFAIFSNKADFTGATFLEETDFTGATFLEEVVFSETRFVKYIDFKRANFKWAVFFLCKASCGSNFGYAKFSERAEFVGTYFLESVNFYKTNFKRGVNFANCRFLKEAFFVWTKFGETVDNIADFRSAIFSESAIFGNSFFPGKTVFIYSLFKGETEFTNCDFGTFTEDFNSYADFTASTFLGHLDFGYSKFMKAVFASTSFGEKTDFTYTVFTNAKFTQAYFSGQATFYKTNFREKPDFSDVLFENARKVLFSVDRLYATSFINTDVTSVRFSKDLKWEQEGWEKHKNEKIDSSVDLEALKAVYRNLRENYENSFRFFDAQVYHIREMDLKRKYRLHEKPIVKGIKPEPKKNGFISCTLSLTGL